MIIQEGQVIPEENIRTRRIREPSKIERNRSYNIVEDLAETQVHMSFAQALKDPKQMKMLKDALKGKNHVEIADEQ